MVLDVYYYVLILFGGTMKKSTVIILFTLLMAFFSFRDLDVAYRSATDMNVFYSAVILKCIACIGIMITLFKIRSFKRSK